MHTAASQLAHELERWDVPEIAKQRARELADLLDVWSDGKTSGPQWVQALTKLENGANIKATAIMGGFAGLLLGAVASKIQEEERRGPPGQPWNVPGEDKADYKALTLACASWRGCTYRLYLEATRPLYLTMKGARHLLQRVRGAIRDLESANRRQHRGRPLARKAAR